MPPIFSLAHLTALDVDPPGLVTIAARAGYQKVGLRLLPASPNGIAYPLMSDKAALAVTIERLRDTGVEVFDLEIIRLNPQFQANDFMLFFEVGARLGAKAMLIAGDDPDEARLTASFAALCEAAAPFGLSADLEFMPWTRSARCRDGVADRHPRGATQWWSSCRRAAFRALEV